MLRFIGLTKLNTANFSRIRKTLLEWFFMMSPTQRSGLSALMGFAFYGSWAFGVNFMHGTAKAVMAACVQGSYSFLLTFVSTMLIEFFFRLSCSCIRSKSLVSFATVVLSCTVIFSGSWLVNYLAGTPEIWRTVALGYVVGGWFVFWYVRQLSGAILRQE